VIDWAAGTCAGVSLATAARIAWLYWSGPASVFLRVKSSVWVALAWTFARGEFYRPVLAANGYGGTRYMPLLFVLHGLLIRAGADPIWSGVALMHTTVAAAAAALFVALRRVGVDARLAAPLAATVWGTVIFQQSATDLSPDYLAAALSLAAASIAYSRAPATPRGRSIAAGLLFALAATAKITAIAFAAPVVAVLWADGRRAAASRVAVWTAIGVVAMVAAIDAASAGRFHASFLASATAGLTIGEVVGAAPQFVRELAIKPFDVGVPFAIAAWCVVTTRRRTWAHAYFAAAIVIAVAIFAAPGTASNHLVDLHLASILVVGVSLVRRELSERVGAAMFGATAAMLVAITIPLPGIPSVVADVRAAMPRPRDAARALHAEFLTRGPYLAIDPIVPVLNGDRPWVIDYGSIERYYVEGTPAGRDFEARVRRHFFTAIVLPDGYESEITPLLRETYPRVAERKPFVVRLPAAD